jgi:hypothetical protein
MRKLLLSVLCLGTALPAWAQSPAAPAPHHAPATARSPIGAAMANLSRALHDAAEQARRPAAADTADDSATTVTAPASSPATQPSPQPSAQAALP